MLGRLYENQECSATRTLELVGERWSLLILRDAMFRNFTRFSQFQKSLGIATNVLTRRLEGFVEALDLIEGELLPGVDLLIQPGQFRLVGRVVHSRQVPQIGREENPFLGPEALGSAHDFNR